MPQNNVNAADFSPVGYVGNEKGPVYVALGDDIACGAGLNNPASESYTSLVGEAINASKVINLGVEGITSTQLLANIQDGINKGAGNKIYDALVQADIITLNVGFGELLGQYIPLLANELEIDTNGKTDAQLLEEIRLEIIAKSQTPRVWADTSFALLKAMNTKEFDKFFYVQVALSNNLNSIVSQIKTVSPNAQIHILNVYTPYAGVVFSGSNGERTILEFEHVFGSLTRINTMIKNNDRLKDILWI